MLKQLYAALLLTTLTSPISFATDATSSSQVSYYVYLVINNMLDVTGGQSKYSEKLQASKESIKFIPTTDLTHLRQEIERNFGVITENDPDQHLFAQRFLNDLLENDSRKAFELIFKGIQDNIQNFIHTRNQQQFDQQLENFKDLARHLSEEECILLRAKIQGSYNYKYLSQAMNLNDFSNKEESDRKVFQKSLDTLLGPESRNAAPLILKNISANIKALGAFNFQKNMGKKIEELSQLAILLSDNERRDLRNKIQQEYGHPPLDWNVFEIEQYQKNFPVFLNNIFGMDSQSSEDTSPQQEEPAAQPAVTTVTQPTAQSFVTNQPNRSEDINAVETVYDQAYHDFMAGELAGYPGYLDTFKPNEITNPTAYFKSNYTLNNDHPIFLPGKYAQATLGIPYWSQFGLEEGQNRGQGWKIHVSAMPKSALKIAQIALPIVKKYPRLSYKIITTIPLMRTLWAYTYVQGSETQPGKFLVIYSNSPQQAYEIIKEIDTALQDAINKGELDSSDFLRLKGDAMVGTSGGVFVRYGNYFGKNVKHVNPLDKTMDIEGYGFSYDDRFYPWPDFMNKKTEFWRNIQSPFRELPVQWVDFTNPKHKIMSWTDRPESWVTMADTAEQKEDLRQSQNFVTATHMDQIAQEEAEK